MITVCGTCGNYTVKQGDEIATARAMVKRLREDFLNEEKRRTVVSSYMQIAQLLLEVELLASAIHETTKRPELTLVSA